MELYLLPFAVVRSPLGSSSGGGTTEGEGEKRSQNNNNGGSLDKELVASRIQANIQLPQNSQSSSLSLKMMNLTFTNKEVGGGEPARATSSQRFETSKARTIFRDLRQTGTTEPALVEEFKRLSLEKQFEAFENGTAETEEGRIVRDAVITQLTSLIKVAFPTCQLFPFGSYMTNLLEEESDLDIFVQLVKGQRYNSDKKKEMNRIYYLLHEAEEGTWCRNIEILGRTVPIIRFIHRQTNLQCDLSFQSPLGLRNTKLLASYMQYQPVIRSLLKVVRFWARYHGISGSLRIKNYSFALLVLTFCGQQQMIPSLLKMQSILRNMNAYERNRAGGVKRDYVVDGWDTSFLENGDALNVNYSSSVPPLVYKSSVHYTSYLVAQLQGFLKFCEDVDFPNSVVCTNGFEIIPREILPTEVEDKTVLEGNDCSSLKKYRKWANNQINQKFGCALLPTKGPPICIQDPFAINVNVSSPTHSEVFERFQEISKTTRQMLVSKTESNTFSLLDLFSPTLLYEGIGDDSTTSNAPNDVAGKLIKEINQYLSKEDNKNLKKTETNASSSSILSSAALHIRQKMLFVKNFARSVKQFRDLNRDIKSTSVPDLLLMSYTLWEGVLISYFKTVLVDHMDMEMEIDVALNKDKRDPKDLANTNAAKAFSEGSHLNWKKEGQIPEDMIDVVYDRLMRLSPRPIGIRYLKYTLTLDDESRNRINRLQDKWDKMRRLGGKGMGWMALCLPSPVYQHPMTQLAKANQGLMNVLSIYVKITDTGVPEYNIAVEVESSKNSAGYEVIREKELCETLKEIILKTIPDFTNQCLECWFETIEEKDLKFKDLQEFFEVEPETV